jgi:hypothetical protein
MACLDNGVFGRKGQGRARSEAVRESGSFSEEKEPKRLF